MIRPAHAALFGLVFLAACAGVPEPLPAGSERPTVQPAPFSRTVALEGLPEGWAPYKLARFKPLTQFALVREEGVTVVRARSKSSVSGLQTPVNVDLHEYPVIRWRWNVTRPVDGDTGIPAKADSAARIVLTFEGGREDLPAYEQLNYDLAYALTGNPLPFATLMYTWEPGKSPGEVVTHYNSSRVKMIVATGQPGWNEVRVNVLEDYRRAFGEEPPRVKTVGILSDSDNTGTEGEAYFGDIVFEAR
jgi:hypothetical protein